MRRIGLIAGEGMLPVVWAEAAHNQGIEVITIGITPDTNEELLKEYSTRYYSISVGKLGQIIETLQTEQIIETVMLGKVQKLELYRGLELDQRLLGLLARLPEKNDDAILLALVQELASEGIQFLEQSTFMDSYLAHEGLLTSSLELSPEMQADIEFGFKMAKEVGRLDIGQTVVVKGGAVIAVEAIEGTDQAILRSGELTRGAVVAKVAKPQQDQRFDIPTIGLQTMQNLVQVGAQALVVEAEKTFFIQQDQVLQLANEHGIVIMGMR